MDWILVISILGIAALIWAWIRWSPFTEKQMDRIMEDLEEAWNELERMKKSGKITEDECEILKEHIISVERQESIEKELDELERMKKSGKITEGECEILKKKIVTNSDEWWRVRKGDSS